MGVEGGGFRVEDGGLRVEGACLRLIDAAYVPVRVPV